MSNNRHVQNPLRTVSNIESKDVQKQIFENLSSFQATMRQEKIASTIALKPETVIQAREANFKDIQKKLLNHFKEMSEYIREGFEGVDGKHSHVELYGDIPTEQQGKLFAAYVRHMAIGAQNLINAVLPISTSKLAFNTAIDSDRKTNNLVKILEKK